MTSIATNSSAPQASTTNASSSSSTANARSPSATSGQNTSAAVTASAPAPRPLSYANAAASTKKQPPTGPGAASSSSNPASQVSGGVSGQHARSASTTSAQVNGKTPPAVPQVSNTLANGASTPYSGGQHSRKSSIATGAMPNGASRIPNIKFGNVNEPAPGPQHSGTAAAAGNLTAPQAQNPRASSPSPSAAAQPAASGGAPPSASTARPPLQFGDTTPQQRPMSLPPPAHPPQGPGSMGRGHNRGESVQSETTQAPHGRGMPAGRGNRHQGGYQQNNQFQNASYGYGGRGGYQGGNQQRNGPNNMGPNPYPQQQFPSPRVPPRSPALSHVSTHHSPSMAPAVPTTHTPQLYPPQPHGQQFMPPGGPQYPGQQMYDPMYGYQQYPPMYNTQFPPNTSPRPHYVSPQMGGYPPYGQQGAQPMSRTSSTNMGDIHRPPSSIGQHGQPSMAPQQQHMMVGTPPPGTPAPQPYARTGKKASKAISIKKPDGTELKIDKPAAPAPVATPVIVSSPATPGRTSSRPEAPHSRSTSRSNKTAEEKRAEMREKVLQEAQKAEQQKAAEQDRLRKEEEEKKLKAEAEAKAKAEEEEERAKAEAEAKAKEEAEAKAKEEAEAKAKAEAEAKAKAEAEAAEKEAQEKAAKEAEEKAAKEAEEAKAKAEAEAEVAKVAEEVKADPAPETPVDTPADTPTETSKAGTPDSESMPPPSLKSMEKARSKPSPLNLQLRTTEPAPPSAQLTALRSARPLENLKNLAYPEGIQSPNPALNPLANATKFKYDKEFLMQFQNVFTEKPSVDWDQRMKETVGDTESARPGSSARTPSGLGPRGSSSRGSSGMTFGGAMGSFATGPGSKPASALTSMERFKASTNPLAMMGSLTSGRPSGIVRTGSSTSLAGAQNALPQSPARASNRSARGSSKRGNAGAAPPMERTDSRGPSQPTIPLAEVKPLPVSANRWTPRSIKAAAEATAAPAAAAGGPELMSPELVQRKVKAALNKMTPEKFDKISDQILEITGQSKHESDGRTLRQVIQLTFEKACDEAHWASMYAKFCKRMLETMDPNIKDENVKDKHGVLVTGGALFRKYLLNRCQEEFERGWKVNMPAKPEGVSDEVMMLSDEYYIAAAAKRRGLGLVQFIGELFKLNMLTERIMNECVRKLLDFEGIPEDETVESLSKLLRTIGAQLDSSEKSKPMMDLYFGRIQGMIENKELNSRMRFMLMDVIDLRKKGWETKEADKGPKTIQEVREEALKAQQEKEAASKASRNRPQAGRGDARSFSSNNFGGMGGQSYHDSKTAGTVNADDLRKLGSRSSGRQTSSGPQTFGPMSSLGPRGSGSRRGLGSSSRDGTNTPPVPASTSSPNPFSALQEASHNDGNEATSPPPSNANSPQVSNAKPVTDEA